MATAQRISAHHFARTPIGANLTLQTAMTAFALILITVLFVPCTEAAQGELLPQPINTWVKRTPVPMAQVSPRLGYEGACVWDNIHRVMIRYGGHNQGGGGEQGSEIWTFDPFTTQWVLKEPNWAPPGVCCNAQNVFEPSRGRYIRFPSFSGSHGWQWWREIYLNDASVWTYDLSSNIWRNMRPLPAPHVAPLRCASWDSDAQVVLVFGGEGGPRETLSYDPHRNEWRWMKPKSQPEPRSGGQMAYDSKHKVHVLFGSQFTDDPHTWIYDLAKNDWRDAKPSIQPPTDKNDAVLTYDPVRGVIVAIIKVTTGKEDEARHALETWTYDVAANQWSKLGPPMEPEPSGNRARQLMFAPELGMALLENCPSKPREQQIWTLRLAEGKSAILPAASLASRAGPPLVEDATVSVLSPARVALTWKAPARSGIVGYHVERAAVEVLSEAQLIRLKKQTSPLSEPSVGAFRRISSFARLTTAPVKETTFTDSGVDLSKQTKLEGETIFERKFNREQVDETASAYRFAVFAYRIRTVSEAGEESGPSPVLFTIPSAPQWLFSKEAGTTCHLKWAANPEQALMGYRVYRMDGRYDKDPIPRLTPAPITTTSYSDTAAGKSSHRYYVVAVDKLGQEGFPSAPVWFEREWKQYYKPFVGEWHQ
jgi:hypothetical protein